MAVTIPIISEFSDKGITAANAAFNNFKTKIAEADGAMGKLKAGFGAAGDFIKANAMAFTAVAGTAIATFAIKGIKEFTDLALAASKFADATGLAVEDASRWIEVSGDLGVESGAVQAAINKMNIAISAQKQEFKDLGVEIARTDTGLVDVNGTFINTLDRLKNIPNATERARLGAAVLGKGWAEMAELVQMGSGRLKQSLDAVSDAKVIDAREVERAKDFRESMDKLGDAFQDLAINLGTILVPALNLFNNTAGEVIESVSDLFGGASDLDEIMNNVEKVYSQKVVKSLALAEDGFYKNTVAMGEARYNALKLGDAINVLDGDTNGLIDTWDSFLFKLNQDEAWKNLEQQITDYKTSVSTAFKEGTNASLRESERMKISVIEDFARIVQEAGIASQAQIRILALLEQGEFDKALNLLKTEAAKGIAMPVYGVYQGVQMPVGQTPSESRGVAPRLMGAMAAPAGNVIVNVGGSVTTENDLVEAIRKGLVNSQRNGSNLVYSNF